MEPIRLIPVKGESFSGYLMRMATENTIDIFELLRAIKTTHQLNEMRQYHQIDSNPYEKLDIGLIMQLTDLEPEELSAMTYIPLYRKFVDESETLISLLKSILKNCVERQYRRFCPFCLKDYCGQDRKGVFMLHWQVKDIECCHIHNVPLTSTCPRCGAMQPYITNSLGSYICFKCSAELFDVSRAEMDNIVYTDKDNRLFQLWDYLLDIGTRRLGKVPGLKYEVQMAITLIYLLEKKKRGRVIAPVMNKDERRSALLFVQNRDLNLFVTAYRLSTLLVRADLTAEDFFNCTVPEDFIELIAKRLKIDRVKLARLEAIKPYKRRIRHRREPEQVKKIALDYLRHRSKDKGPVTNKEVYSNIGVNRECLHYEVTQFIADAIKEYNRQLKESIYKEIEKNAIELLNSGEKVTYKILAERVGVHVMFIKRNKEIIRRINKIKSAYA